MCSRSLSALSIGLVVTKPCGQELDRMDIIITPDGNDPKRDDYAARKIHKMYVTTNKNGEKVVMRRMDRIEDDYVLKSSHPPEAADLLIKFLENVGSDNPVVLFHGDDEHCLIPFLIDHGLDQRFYDLVGSIVDTRGFFKMIQENRGEVKYGMEKIIQDFGSQEDKELYKKGAHRALTDALLLSRVCGAMGDEFTDWVSSDQIRKIYYSKKLRGRFSNWLIWEKPKP